MILNLVRYPHLEGSTREAHQGWDYYEQLAANGAQASGGNGGVLQAVAGGEKMYGMIVEFLPIREKAKGTPVEFVFPEEGVSAISAPVAILANTQNPEAAKAFIDFLISREGQEMAASLRYQILDISFRTTRSPFSPSRLSSAAVRRTHPAPRT